LDISLYKNIINKNQLNLRDTARDSAQSGAILSAAALAPTVSLVGAMATGTVTANLLTCATCELTWVVLSTSIGVGVIGFAGTFVLVCAVGAGIFACIGCGTSLIKHLRSYSRTDAVYYIQRVKQSNYIPGIDISNDYNLTHTVKMLKKVEQTPKIMEEIFDVTDKIKKFKWRCIHIYNTPDNVNMSRVEIHLKISIDDILFERAIFSIYDRTIRSFDQQEIRIMSDIMNDFIHQGANPHFLNKQFFTIKNIRDVISHDCEDILHATIRVKDNLCLMPTQCNRAIIDTFFL